MGDGQNNPLDKNKPAQLEQVIRRALANGSLSSSDADKALEKIQQWYKAIDLGDMAGSALIGREVGEMVGQDASDQADDEAEQPTDEGQADGGEQVSDDEGADEADETDQPQEETQQSEDANKKPDKQEDEKKKEEEKKKQEDEKKKQEEEQKKKQQEQNKENQKEGEESGKQPTQGGKTKTGGPEGEQAVEPGGGPVPTAGGAAKSGASAAEAEAAEEAAGAAAKSGAASKIVPFMDTAMEAGRDLEGGIDAEEAKHLAGTAAKDLIVKFIGGKVLLIIGLVILAILVIIGIVGLFMTFTGKSVDLAGGSAFIPMRYGEESVGVDAGTSADNKSEPNDMAIAAAVQQAVAEGRLEFTDPRSLEDIKWKTKDKEITVLQGDKALAPPIEIEGPIGTKYMVLDRRIMQTLAYLTRKWPYLRVSLSYSNGPSLTRRFAVIKVGAFDNYNASKLLKLIKGDLSVLTEPPLDTVSAYRTGQAIGIDRIGKVSTALQVACFAGRPVAVQVGWQRFVREADLRKAYEYFQVDATHLAQNFFVLRSMAQSVTEEQTALAENPKRGDGYTQTMLKSLGEKEGRDTIALTSIENIVTELEKVMPMTGLDERAKELFTKAYDELIKVRDAVKPTEGVERLQVWGKDELQTSVVKGLHWLFRGMQVANMVDWRGSTKAAARGGAIGGAAGGVIGQAPAGALVGAVVNTCKYWEAYEARQNVRQLELDLLQMPMALEFLNEGEKFNPELIVKQLIVYSPEDDLDNGLGDEDVFPSGAVAVDEGGIAYDAAENDGAITIADEHFKKLPVDNGVFSKAGTIFVYRKEWPEFHNAWKFIADLWKMEFTMVIDPIHDILTGAGVSIGSNEDVEKVSYKYFVHVAF